jgi:hypothetical protein
MNKVQKLSKPNCNTPLSEPCRIKLSFSYSINVTTSLVTTAAYTINLACSERLLTVSFFCITVIQNACCQRITNDGFVKNTNGQVLRNKE